MRLCILLLVICVCFEASSASRLGRLFGSALAVHRKGKKEGAAKKGNVQRTSKAKTVALKKLKEAAALSKQKVKIDVVDVPVVEDASTALKTAKKQDSLIGRQQTVLSIARMILSRFVFKINYKDPQTLVYARVTFVAYLVLFQALLWFLNQQVSKRDDSTILHKNPGSGVQSLISKLGGLAGQGAMTNTLLNLASLGGSASDKDKITVKSHDMKQIKELTSTLYFELFTTSLMHFVFGFQVPVLMTPVLGLCKLVQHPLVLLHLFRFRPVGQLERPFKTGFESFINTLASPTTPDASTASETPFPDLSGATSASGEQSAKDTSDHEEEETESADQSTQDDVTAEEEDEAEVPPSAHAAADGDNDVEDNTSVDVESGVVDADEVDEVESSGEVSEEEDEGEEEESSADTEEEEDGVQDTEGGEEVDTEEEVEEDAANSAEDTDEAEEGEEESEEVAEEDDTDEGEGSVEGEEPETEEAEEEQEGADDDDNEVEEEEEDEVEEEEEGNDEVNDEEEEDSELMDAIDHLGE